MTAGQARRAASAQAAPPSRGAHGFTTITVTPGLSPAARRRARRSGPRAVTARADHGRLLDTAGFVDIEEFDVTSAFLATARTWIEQYEDHTGELAALEPAGAFEARQRERRVQLAAIEDDLLRHGLFSARVDPSLRRPTRRSSTVSLLSGDGDREASYGGRLPSCM